MMFQCERTKEEVEDWENKNLNGKSINIRFYESLSYISKREWISRKFYRWS
jgi:hypothetical protein